MRFSMSKKILVLTEMAFQGSGYYYLMSPILEGLSKLGYDVKVIGLSYDGSEYHYGFSIIPAGSVQDGVAIAQNLVRLWKPDIFICGMDIPIQISIHENLKSLGIKYIAVTPLENPPLTQSWIAQLMNLDFVFFISELGKQTALKAGLTKVDHLKIGVNQEIFKPADNVEIRKVRADLGVKDEFVILTVADNQERKNIWAEFEIVSNLKKAGKKVKFILVTREGSPVGYKLRDFAIDYDINKELVVIERGISQTELRNLYISSDIYLSTSKSEGLGIPILEAMACGLPVVACDTGAIHELLMDNRGYLIEPEYKYRDVWGNSWRFMIDKQKAFSTILGLIEGIVPENMWGWMTRCQEFISSRSFELTVSQMDSKLKELLHEEEE